MSITRKQASRLNDIIFDYGVAIRDGNTQRRETFAATLTAYLDSLVAEPAEQPKGLATGMWSAMSDEAFVHADDARAAMQGMLADGYSGTNERLASLAHAAADAMAAERKRRQG